MKQISDRFRKILRTVFRGIGVSVVSLIIQACYGVLPPDVGTVAYGMPPPKVNGKVKKEGTETAIQGIKVSDEDSGNYALTDKDGYFYIFVNERESYKINIEDIDGEANGGKFKQKTLTLNKNQINDLSIGLDPDTE
jgi:hypothetical protein